MRVQGVSRRKKSEVIVIYKCFIFTVAVIYYGAEKGVEPYGKTAATGKSAGAARCGSQ